MDSESKVGDARPNRQSDIAKWMREHGYSTLAAVDGNAFFVHDDVADSISDVLLTASTRRPQAQVGLDSVVEMLQQHSQMLAAIQNQLDASQVTYERAFEEAEQTWRARVDRVEQKHLDAESTAVARLAIIQEQQRALEYYRYWWWGERLRRSWAPKLGVLYQYAPHPLVIPDWYRRPPQLTGDAPTVSIVTPSLNQGTFIEHTIRSVLDQKYTRLEYIVQDALSSDDTPQILERFGDSLAHVDSRADTGFANGINMGFAHATGEIMAYLNSDDLLLPGALHYVAQYFLAHPEVDVVYGHRVIIDEHDGEIGRWVLPGHDEEVLSWADYVPQETLFWRRRIWDKVGGAIDESFRFAIDWDLLLRFRDAGARMHRLPRFLGAFRVHPQQKTSAHMEEFGMHEMARLRERCHGRQVTTGEIADALRAYLRKHVIQHKLYRLGILRY
jgi:GT2 family glycosyltransferase